MTLLEEKTSLNLELNVYTTIFTHRSLFRDEWHRCDFYQLSPLSLIAAITVSSTTISQFAAKLQLYFLKVDQPWFLFYLFPSFRTFVILKCSRNWTWIFGVESRNFDHKTNTTAQDKILGLAWLNIFQQILFDLPWDSRHGFTIQWSWSVLQLLLKCLIEAIS